MVFAPLWGPGGSSIVCHCGERELKSTAAARLSLSLTACSVASDSHLLPERPNSTMGSAAAHDDRVQADAIPPALSIHGIVIPRFSLHPFLSSSQLTEMVLVSPQSNRSVVQVASSSLQLITQVTLSQ